MSAITNAVIQTANITTSTVAGSTSGSANGQSGTFNSPYAVVLDSAGNIYVSDYENNRIRRITPSGNVSTYAGSGAAGSTDGNGTNASFNQPFQLAIDPFGNIYVAERNSNKIRKIDTFRNVTTFAGSGNASDVDGQGTSASFSYPTGITIDSAGFFYVSGQGNRIRRITPMGYVTTYAGTGSSGANDGQWNVATFNFPFNLASGSNVIYVTDSFNHKIRSITETRTVSTYAPSASTDYSGVYEYTAALAFDSSGNLYLADQTTSVIWKITGDGATITAFAGSLRSQSYADGQGASARFNQPSALAFDTAGNIYVTDLVNQRIRKIDTAGNVSTYAGSGGSSSTDGIWHNASFYFPYGIAVDSSGAVYVAENSGNRIKKIVNTSTVFKPYTGVLSVAVDSSLNVYASYDGNGTYVYAKFNSSGTLQFSSTTAAFVTPVGMAVDSSGAMYIADTGNDSIKMVSTDGATISTYISPIREPRGLAFSGDTLYVARRTGVGKIIPASTIQGITINVNYANSIAIDSSGNIYLTLPYYNQVRKYNSTGTLLNTYGDPAGSSVGTSAWVDSIYQTVVRFNFPTGIAVASGTGNIYIADTNNHVIRQITPSGITTTLAGTGGSAGYVNGSYLSSKFNEPYGITLDPSENAYITDRQNNLIRKLSGGQVTTYAGSLAAGFIDSTAFTYTQTVIATIDRVSYPYNNFAIDSNGDVYFITTNSAYRNVIYYINSTGQILPKINLPTNFYLYSIVFSSSYLLYVSVQHINESWAVYTVTKSGVYTLYAGSSTEKGFVDNVTRLNARFYSSLLITIDNYDNVYLSDMGNIRIRKISASGFVTTVAGNGVQARVDGVGSDGQGSASSIFYVINALTADKYGYVYFIDMVGDIPAGKLRIISPSGYVSTPSWGRLPWGMAGDYVPYCMVVDDDQCLYIRRKGEIMKIFPNGEGAQTIFSDVTSDPPFIIGSMGRGSDGYIYYHVVPPRNSFSYFDFYKFATPVSPRFNIPVGITYSSGNLYVADYGNNAIRRISTTAGTTISALATVATVASSATFSSPYAIAVYGGSLYVTENNLDNIRKIDLGTNVVSTLSPYTKPTGIAFNPSGNIRVLTNGNLSVPTESTAAAYKLIAVGFTSPMGLCLDSSGNIYVADQGTSQIKKIDTSSNVTVYAGTSAGYADGPTSSAQFSSDLTGICIIGNIIYVGDKGNSAIRTIYNGVVSTYATGVSPGYIAVDTSGVVYVPNAGTNIIKLSRDVTTFVGSGTGSYADGNGTSASFNGMFQIAIDTSNNLYVADNGNRRIRKVTPGGTVTTLAGSGGTAFINGPSATAQFNPVGIYADSAGLVYITDTTNHTIRLIYPDGYVTSIAGSGSYGFLDGSAGIARFAAPRGLVGDSSGNIYVADQGNNRLRKIALSRTVATFAGTGGSGATNGAAASATFNVPFGIAIDGASVYVADLGGHDIRKISGGQVTTYAGSSQGSADGTSATFNYPRGLATDSAGNVYVADEGNFRIRKISPYSYANTLFYANTTDVYKLPLTTMTPASIVTGQANINGMTCDRTYVYATCGSMVKSFHMTSGTVTILAGTASPGSANGTSQASVGFNNLQSIAIDPTFTNLYVCDNGNGQIRKIQISPLSVSTQADLTDCVAIAVDSYGTYAYASITTGGFYRVSLLQSNIKTLLVSVPGYPQYVSLDPTNTYAYITRITDNRISQVNLLTNTLTTIAGSGTNASVNGAGTTASFSSPYGIVFNPNDAFLYSTDRGTGLLRRTATQVFLSSMIGLTQSKTVPTILPTASMTNPQAYEFIHNNGGTIRTTPNLYLLGNTITASLDIRATSYTVTAKTFTAISGTAGTGGYFVGEGTGVTVTSDIRVKENIQPIGNALDIVRQLQAVEYTKIDDPSRRWLGYIAQDVEHLIPHIVRTDASPQQWKSIQYTYLPGLIIEALKELKAKIDKIECLSTETV